MGSPRQPAPCCAPGSHIATTPPAPTAYASGQWGTLKLQRLRPGGIDAEDLAVADAPRARHRGDALRDQGGALVAHPDGDLHLGQERQAVLAAGVAVEVALLPAVALGLLHDAGADVQLGQG